MRAPGERFSLEQVFLHYFTAAISTEHWIFELFAFFKH